MCTHNAAQDSIQYWFLRVSGVLRQIRTVRIQLITLCDYLNVVLARPLLIKLVSARKAHYFNVSTSPSRTSLRPPHTFHAPPRTMVVTSVEKLKRAHDALCQWIQPFVLPDGTDLALAIGPKGTNPPLAYQPSCYPVDRWQHPLSHFMFDPGMFLGPSAFDSLVAFIKKCCPGVTWVVQNTAVDCTDSLLYRLRCSHYKINHHLEQSVFEDGKFTRPNVVPAREKKKKSSNQYSFNKMGTVGLKIPKSRKRKHQPANLQRDSPHMAPPARRTDTKMADSAHHRCHAQIVLFMCKHSQRWFLKKTTNLEHKFHASEVTSNLLTEDDLLDDQKKYLYYLVDHGVSPTTISQVMTKVANDSGRTGEFLPDTIANIGKKTQNMMDELKGISHDWSVAQKTLGVLHA